MQLEETREGPVLVLHPSGRLDAETAPAFQDEVLSRVEGTTSLVLDLASVHYVSSAGLRVVLLAAKQLEKGGGKLVVCSLQETVLEVFRVSGMDTIIETTDDRSSAIAAIG